MFEDLQSWPTAYSASVRIWGAIKDQGSTVFPQILENYGMIDHRFRFFLCSALLKLSKEDSMKVSGFHNFLLKLWNTVKDPRLYEAVISDADDYTKSAAAITTPHRRRVAGSASAAASPLIERRLSSISSASSLPFV